MINVDDVTLWIFVISAKFRPNRNMIPLPINAFYIVTFMINLMSNINLDLDQICLLSD